MNTCNYTVLIDYVGTKIIYSYKYKTWIRTLIRVNILKYTYNYRSSYTIIEFL